MRRNVLLFEICVKIGKIVKTGELKRHYSILSLNAHSRYV